MCPRSTNFPELTRERIIPLAKNKKKKAAFSTPVSFPYSTA